MDFAAKGLRYIGVSEKYRPFTASEAKNYRRTSVARNGAIKAVKAAKAAKITIAQKEYKSAVDGLLDCFRSNNEVKILGSLIFSLVFFDPAAGESVAEILGKNNLTDADLQKLNDAFKKYSEENKTNAEALRNATNTINKVTESAQQCAANLVNKTNELGEAYSLATTLTNQLTATKAERDGINTTLTTTEANLAEKTTKFTTTLAALAGMNKTLTETQANLAETTTKLTTTQAALAGMNTTLTERESDLAEMNRTYIQTAKQLSDVLATLTATQAKYALSESNFTAFRNRSGKITKALRGELTEKNRGLNIERFIGDCENKAKYLGFDLFSDKKLDVRVKKVIDECGKLRNILNVKCNPTEHPNLPGYIPPVSQYLSLPNGFCDVQSGLAALINGTFSKLIGNGENNRLPCNISGDPTRTTLLQTARSLKTALGVANNTAKNFAEQNFLNYMNNAVNASFGIAVIPKELEELNEKFFQPKTQITTQTITQTIEVIKKINNTVTNSTVTDGHDINWWNSENEVFIPFVIVSAIAAVSFLAIVIPRLSCMSCNSKTKNGASNTGNTQQRRGLNFGGG